MLYWRKIIKISFQNFKKSQCIRKLAFDRLIILQEHIRSVKGKKKLSIEILIRYCGFHLVIDIKRKFRNRVLVKVNECSNSNNKGILL